jgi:pimeloyl-ACP methyl ester carboxylesterase
MNLPERRCMLSDKEVISYRVHGVGPRKVVLVHGLAARSQSWSDFFPLFSPDTYTVYLTDLLGSGESSKPPDADYSMKAHGQRLLKFLAKLGLSGVTLVGHSLGGAVALMVAIEEIGRREKLIEALVVMAGPGFIQRLPLMAEIFQSKLAARLFVAVPSPAAWVKIGLRAAYHDSRLVDREHVARYLPCYRERDSKRALVKTCTQLVPPDCEEIYACYERIRIPVLLLWGRHDRIVPLAQGERLHGAILGARLEVIEECGHNPQEEKPNEAFRIISGFILGILDVPGGNGACR